jgi:hypothetical protein
MKQLIGWVIGIVMFCVVMFVMTWFINDQIGSEAQERKIRNRDYKYQVTCTVNGKTITEYFLDCYSGQSGLRCGNSRATTFLCQGNYSYTIVPK